MTNTKKRDRTRRLLREFPWLWATLGEQQDWDDVELQVGAITGKELKSDTRPGDCVMFYGTHIKGNMPALRGQGFGESDSRSLNEKIYDVYENFGYSMNIEYVVVTDTHSFARIYRLPREYKTWDKLVDKNKPDWARNDEDDQSAC